MIGILHIGRAGHPDPIPQCILLYYPFPDIGVSLSFTDPDPDLLFLIYII